MYIYIYIYVYIYIYIYYIYIYYWGKWWETEELGVPNFQTKPHNSTLMNEMIYRCIHGSTYWSRGLLARTKKALKTSIRATFFKMNDMKFQGWMNIWSTSKGRFPEMGAPPSSHLLKIFGSMKSSIQLLGIPRAGGWACWAWPAFSSARWWLGCDTGTARTLMLQALSPACFGGWFFGFVMFQNLGFTWI